MATPNLAITTVVASQNQKEVTINDALTLLDEATQDTIDVDCAAAGTVTVSSTNYTHNFFFRLTGAPGADFNLQMPDGKRIFSVHNTTTKTATIKATSAGGTVALVAGQVAVIASRGVDIVQLSASPAAGVPISMVVMVPGLPVDNATVFHFKTAIAFTLPVNCAGSYSSALTASTGNVKFDIKKNGADIGDVTFNVTATGAFTLAGGASFAVGDVFSLVAPTPQDATLSDVSFTFLATRS